MLKAEGRIMNSIRENLCESVALLKFPQVRPNQSPSHRVAVSRSDVGEGLENAKCGRSIAKFMKISNLQIKSVSIRVHPWLKPFPLVREAKMIGGFCFPFGFGNRKQMGADENFC